MKKETKYQPIYSDILESQKQTGNAEKINGVSYLPGELSDQERSQFQEIKKERCGVILFTVFSCILSIGSRREHTYFSDLCPFGCRFLSACTLCNFEAAAA